MEQNYIYEQDWINSDLEWDETHFTENQSLVNDWDQFDLWVKSFLDENSETLNFKN